MIDVCLRVFIGQTRLNGTSRIISLCKGIGTAWLLVFCLTRGITLSCYFASLCESKYFLVYRQCAIQIFGIAYERCPKYACSGRPQTTLVYGMDKALLKQTTLLFTEQYAPSKSVVFKLQHIEMD